MAYSKARTNYKTSKKYTKLTELNKKHKNTGPIFVVVQNND